MRASHESRTNGIIPHHACDHALMHIPIGEESPYAAGVLHRKQLEGVLQTITPGPE